MIIIGFFGFLAELFWIIGISANVLVNTKGALSYVISSIMPIYHIIALIIELVMHIKYKISNPILKSYIAIISFFLVLVFEFF